MTDLTLLAAAAGAPSRLNPVQLFLDVTFHGSGDIDVVTSDVQLHGSLLNGSDY